MEQKVRHIETIAEYQTMLGVETLHPLVGVIDFSEVPEMVVQCAEYPYQYNKIVVNID